MDVREQCLAREGLILRSTWMYESSAWPGKALYCEVYGCTRAVLGQGRPYIVEYGTLLHRLFFFLS